MPKSNAPSTQKLKHSDAFFPKSQVQTRKSAAFILIVIFIGLCGTNFYLVLYYLPLPRDSSGIISDLGAYSSLSAFSKYDYEDIHIGENNNRVIEYFHQAGVELDNESLQRLPSWSQIESLIGDSPVILGLDRCEEFQQQVPPLRRMLCSAGMFNSGTNLVSLKRVSVYHVVAVCFCNSIMLVCFN